MRLDSLFSHRITGRFSFIFALLTALLLTGAANAAAAGQSKLPLLYKGNGYRLEPGLMYGWDPDGFGKPLRYVGKYDINDPAGTAIDWSYWGKERAIGVGLARSSGCEKTGPEGCERGYPWNGTHVRVVAWRPRSGHFTRLKISTRVPESSSKYYELLLAYRGPFVPLKTVSWRTIRTSRG